MSVLDAYRDDGPLAAGLHRAGRWVRSSPLLLTTVGAVPLLAVVLRPGADARGPAVALGLTWFLVLAGAASGRELTGPRDWLVPPLLRAVEYAFLVRLTALAAPGAMPACYALLAALAFHHYDTVYRLRHRRVAPPRWLRLAGGGWDGRCAVAYLAVVGDALPVALAVGAATLAVLYGAESVRGWLGPARAAAAAGGTGGRA